MNIIFICGCVEPGQDGVGDYTRLLSAELYRQGHRASIVAMHDRRLTELVWNGTQQSNDQCISVLRLSDKLPWQIRIQTIRKYIDSIDPDWISLQYVPFSFHDKGMSVKLPNVLRQLVTGRSIHIMFHELWVGLSKQSPRKHIVWGMAQRFLIRSLLNICREAVVHTHTPLYQIQLNSLNIQPSVLPLFSNIPVYSPIADKQINPKNSSIRFVLFGGISPKSPIDQLATELAAYASKKKKAIELILIGRNGKEQDRWVFAWRSAGLAVFSLGEQSPKYVSDVLSSSSIGLSTTPIALAGKSGSIAAMHAHGLPVLCVSESWTPRTNVPIPSTLGVTAYSNGHLESFLDRHACEKIRITDVKTVTNQFVQDLIQRDLTNKKLLSQIAY